MPAAENDKRKNNTIPTTRHPHPKVEIVSMEAVPEPPPRSGSVAENLYAEIGKLKPGQAVKAEFQNEQHGNYVRTKLRALAKKDKQFMSSSRSADGKTRYFWLEKL